MKSINLFALKEFSLEDAVLFLTWFSNIPARDVSLDQLKKNLPVRTSKLGPILKVLENFGLVARKQERFSVTPAGKDFAQSAMVVRKAVLRKMFMQVEPVQQIMELLETSASGRLPKRLIHEAFSLGAISIISDLEVHGFIAWAQACDLFGYDKKKDEIFRLETGAPKGPALELRIPLGDLLPRAS